MDIINAFSDSFFAKFAKLFLQLSIGKYLDDRLLIEQLEVNSRDWTGKLSQVKLNVNVLNNEFLDSQPIRIVEVVIPELTVLLSIKESCKALIHGVTIIVEKNVNYKKKRKTKRSTEGGDAVEEEDGIPIGPTAGTSSFVAEEEQEAAFLMDESNSIIDNMLREVYAKLQVECRNIKVVYHHHHHHHQSSLKAPQISPSPVKWLEFTVAKLVCTNSDVSHSSSGRNLASTFATASPGGALSDTQASLFSFDYYSTKVLQLLSSRCTLSSFECCIELCHCITHSDSNYIMTYHSISLYFCFICFTNRCLQLRSSLSVVLLWISASMTRAARLPTQCMAETLWKGFSTATMK